jgi:hypothetical protein
MASNKQMEAQHLNFSLINFQQKWQEHLKLMLTNK